MGLETDFYKLSNGMTPRITPPVTRSFSPASLLWLAPALAADLMGKLGGNEFRDNQLAKIGKGYDPNTGLSKPYFGGQSLDRISEQAAPPFTGGQGDGVLFRIIVEYQSHFGGGFWSDMEVVNVAGAISAIRWEYGDYAIKVYGKNGAVTRMLGGNLVGNGTVEVKFRNIRITRIDGQPYTGGDIPTPVTERDGDTSTKGDRDPDDRVKRAGGAPPPAFKPSGTSTTTSNTTNNTTNNTTSNTTNNTTSNTASTTVNNYNFNGDVNRSFSPAPPTAQPFTPPIVKPSIAPNPKPDKKEEEKKVPPPFTPPVFNGDIGTQLAFLGGTLGIIAANTSPSAQRTNSKNGSCDALQEPSCREGLKNDIVNPINQNIDATKLQIAAILGNQVNQNGVLAGIAAKLTDVFDFLKRVWQNEAINKAMAYITMITVIHNAAMLSRSLLDTLGSALDSGLQVFGLQIKDKEGNQLGIAQAIGTSFQNLIKGIIGADNYTALTNTWLQANRVYQTGINLLSTVQSIVDSSTAVAELTNNRLGTLMNALRNSGSVRENAYGAQSQNVTKFNSFQNKLESLEQGVSNTASITGNIVSVQQSVNELKTNRQEFENSLKDKPVGTGLTENDAEKAAREAKKEQSLYTIGDFSIIKPPETP